MTRRLERGGECVMCGECCKKIRITSILSHIVKQHGTLEEAKAYYSYRGISLCETDEKSDRVLLEIPLECDQLTEDNRCLLHDKPETKPIICHRYPWYEDDVESCGYSFESAGLLRFSRTATPELK